MTFNDRELQKNKITLHHYIFLREIWIEENNENITFISWFQIWINWCNLDKDNVIYLLRNEKCMSASYFIRKRKSYRWLISLLIFSNLDDLSTKSSLMSFFRPSKINVLILRINLSNTWLWYIYIYIYIYISENITNDATLISQMMFETYLFRTRIRQKVRLEICRINLRVDNYNWNQRLDHFDLLNKSIYNWMSHTWNTYRLSSVPKISTLRSQKLQIRTSRQKWYIRISISIIIAFRSWIFRSKSELSLNTFDIHSIDSLLNVFLIKLTWILKYSAKSSRKHDLKLLHQVLS